MKGLLAKMFGGTHEERRQHERGFALELKFSSLVEFAVFVAIIRGGDAMDEDKVRELAERLHHSTEALKAAERADQSAHAPRHAHDRKDQP